jgi:hypothetical protein
MGLDPAAGCRSDGRETSRKRIEKRKQEEIGRALLEVHSPSKRRFSFDLFLIALLRCPIRRAFVGLARIRSGIA